MDAKKSLKKMVKAYGRSEDETRELLCVSKTIWDSWMSGQNELPFFIWKGFMAEIEWEIERDKQREVWAAERKASERAVDLWATGEEDNEE